jgi:hypothetical protein
MATEHKKIEANMTLPTGVLPCHSLAIAARTPGFKDRAGHTHPFRVTASSLVGAGSILLISATTRTKAVLPVGAIKEIIGAARHVLEAGLRTATVVARSTA